MRNSKNQLVVGILLILYRVINYEDIILDVEWLIDEGLNLWLLAYVALDIAPILIAAGMFMNKPVVAGFGSLLGVVVPVVWLIDVDWTVALTRPSNIIYQVTWLLFWLLFAIGCFDKKKGTIWRILAAIVLTVQLVLKIVTANWGYLGIYDTISRLSIILLIVATVIFAVGNSKKSPVKAGNIPTTNSVDSTIEKLTKLKQLLDEGIITQEEFAAKKKQLLGM